MSDNGCETTTTNRSAGTAPRSSPEAGDAEMARLAKALGHPARVAILRLLAERRECVCGEICDELPLAQSTISQHLKVLRSAGLVRGEVDGPRVCYCADPAAIARLGSLITELAEGGACCGS